MIEMGLLDSESLSYGDRKRAAIVEGAMNKFRKIAQQLDRKAEEANRRSNR